MVKVVLTIYHHSSTIIFVIQNTQITDSIIPCTHTLAMNIHPTMKISSPVWYSYIAFKPLFKFLCQPYVNCITGAEKSICKMFLI